MTTVVTKLTQQKVILGIIAALALGFMLVPGGASAKVGDDCSSGTGISNIKCGSGETCDPSTKKCITDVFGLKPIDTQVGSTLGNEDLRTTVGRLINVALSLLGVVAVVIILAGGFKWMTAGGEEEKVGEARKMIFSGIIGLAIILSAWAIALFVLNQLNKATNPDAAANIPDIN